jgi:hypothetical protein
MTPRKKATPPAEFWDEERLPWERQEKETDAAWRAFQVYRDLPHLQPPETPESRSQRAVSARLYPGKSPGKGVTKEIGGWSAKWDWLARVNAYDTHLDRAKRQTLLDALARDTEINLAAYRTMRNKGAAALATHQGSIAPQHAARMVDTAVTGIRREAGLATEIQGSEQGDAFIHWLTSGADPDAGTEWDPEKEEP